MNGNTLTANQAEETTGYYQEPPLVDQLIIRRNAIARKAKADVAKLDREINLLRQSEAENILKSAKETLATVGY